jgi:myo-inositol-1(or 4)-monophosphatase
VARRTFVVDPIDGTRAFLDGKSTWCVSVAVVERGRPLAGVLECPAKAEFFAAALGHGATKDGRAISVAGSREPALVAGPRAIIDQAVGQIGRRIDRASYIPSLAYRIAMVAEGVLDATFIKPHAHDWDIAAAELILTEAGGRLAEPSGSPPIYASADPRHGLLVAGSGPLLDAMVGAIAAMSPSAA